MAATLAQPTLLSYMIVYLQLGAPDGGRDGYLYALGFGLLNVVRSLAQYHALLIALRTGIRVLYVGPREKGMR